MNKNRMNTLISLLFALQVVITAAMWLIWGWWAFALSLLESLVDMFVGGILLVSVQQEDS
jgi:predicted membrane protein